MVHVREETTDPLGDCIDVLEGTITDLRRRASDLARDIPSRGLHDLTEKIRALSDEIGKRCTGRDSESWSTESVQALAEQAKNLQEELESTESRVTTRIRVRIRSKWTRGPAGASSSNINTAISYLASTTSLLRAIHEINGQKAQIKEEAEKKRQSLVDYLSRSEMNTRRFPTFLALKDTPDDLLDFLDDQSYSLRHQRYRRLRGRTTCQWFFELDGFKEWKNSPEPLCLLAHGQGGVGKSVILSRIVDEFGNGESTKPRFAYFYMGHGRVQAARDLLKSVFRQLNRSEDALLPNALDELKSRDSELDWSYATLYRHLDEQLGYFLKEQIPIFILIDALDEENMIDEKNFIQVISMLHSRGSRLLVTSRTDWASGVVDKASCLYVSITPQTNMPGIKEFVEVQLNSSMFVQDICKEDPRFLKRMQDALAEDAQGRFFRCRLQTERLLSQKTPGDLKMELEDLRRLRQDDVVDSAINRILYQQDESNRAVAQRSLIWLSRSRRPISVMGLGEALTIASGHLDRSSLKSDDVLNFDQVKQVCEGLVWADEGSKTATITNYDVEMRVDKQAEAFIPDKMSELGIVCLRYLLLDDFKAGPCQTASDFRQRLKKRPFLEYAACSWMWHVNINAPSSRELDLLMRLNSSPKHLEAAAQTVLWFQCELEQREEEFSSMRENCLGISVLRLAAQMPSPPPWLVTKEDQKAVTSNSLPPGHDSEKRILDFVEYAGSLLARFEEGSSPGSHILKQTIVFDWILADNTALQNFGSHKERLLQCAMEVGDTRLVRILIANSPPGPQFGSKLPPFGSQDSTLYLTEALARGHKPDLDVIRLLLDNNAVNLRRGITPLHIACQRGYDDVVGLFLQYRAPLDGTEGTPPLFLAIEAKEQSVVELLLRHGASINPHLQDETALHRAVKTGNETIIKMLLAKCVDTSLKDAHGQTARFYAKDQEIAQLLDQWEEY